MTNSERTAVHGVALQRGDVKNRSYPEGCDEYEHVT
jgi:hypothetical protein